jgi:hypothetical protein
VTIGKFVADGLVDQEWPWEKLVSQVFLGSENFVARMREFLGDKQEIKEIPHVQRYPGRPALDRLFRVHSVFVDTTQFVLLSAEQIIFCFSMLFPKHSTACQHHQSRLTYL